MKRSKLILFFLLVVTAIAGQPATLPVIGVPKFKKDTISIAAFGAIGDGHTLNTKAIQSTIDAMAKKGGGVVLIPAGLWLTGPIVLQSNINLHLAVGATLLFTKDFDQYPLVKANWEGLPQMRNQSPISATGAQNIAITGKGIIDGNGDAWRMVKKDKLNETQWKRLIASGGVLSEDKKTWYPSEKSLKGSGLTNPGVITSEKDDAFYNSIKDFLRPNLLVLTNCSSILLEGVTFQNSPAWCLHPLMCENLTVRNISVKNPWYAQNGDGVDVESCKKVLIENSVFDVGDDALCMKSGRDAEGRKRGKPTEDVVIRGCTVYAAHGGFVIGSEMSGGVRNIHVSNCSFIGTDIGLRFKSARGRGGIVENIFVNNIYMKDIVGEAILFDLYYMAKDPVPLAGEKREAPKVEAKPVDETTPQFRHFSISNIYCNGAEKAIFIRGLPEMPVKDVLLKNSTIKAKKGVELQETSGVRFQQVKVIDAQTGRPEMIRWSTFLAATVMNTWKDSFAIANKPAKWTYDMGVILKGLENCWLHTGDARYFNYIQQQMDFFVNEEGAIKTYKQSEYNIDNINNGKLLLLLYRVTGKEKYKKAADLLREQLKTHPRTNEGGFWHKKVYPYQMWLDGLYMAEPFYAEYAQLFHEDAAFDDIANQFIYMERHARDSKTGLLYHAWDESRQQQWANKQTGTSPLFWARAMGWYATALVDALDYFPEAHPKRAALIAILNRLVNAIEKQQDVSTGLWKDILNYDGPGKEKNYFEASASCQFVYAIAKGVRKGYLPELKMKIAQKGYEGILVQFVKVENDQANLYGTVSVSGLGGNPYRNGSFEYYMSEPVVVNDPKGMGAFLLAATEMETTETQSIGKGRTVVLDTYYNNEWKKDATGTAVRWHYVWSDKSNSGYSMLGDIFNRYGVQTISLDRVPTLQQLRKAAIYIIVDPDTDKETTQSQSITDEQAAVIADWVKAGGVLVLMGNDAGNAEFKHFNKLAATFGIQFNEDSKNRVQGDQFEQGAVTVINNNPVFTAPQKLYIKEYSSLRVDAPAVAVVKNGEDTVMAIRTYGKGTVFAIGDPWIYNEYLDGRKLPDSFTNYPVAEEWVQWLIKRATSK